MIETVDMCMYYQLRCICGYTYRLTLDHRAKSDQFEHCPICGHIAPLSEFIQREEEKNEEQYIPQY